jgi:hypothetical protein
MEFNGMDMRIINKEKRTQSIKIMYDIVNKL